MGFYKWSSDLALVSRLVKRFKLSDMPEVVDPLLFMRTVQPVTSLDRLTRVPKVQEASGDLTGVLGTYVPYFTVPNGKRWYLKAARRDLTTGSTNVSLYCQAGGTLGRLSVYQAAMEVVSGLNDLTMEEGATIGLIASGNGGDGAKLLTIFYDEEDAWQ